MPDLSQLAEMRTLAHRLQVENAELRAQVANLIPLHARFEADNAKLVAIGRRLIEQLEAFISNDGSPAEAEEIVRLAKAELGSHDA